MPNSAPTKYMQRTLTQNAALHKYFEMLAEELTGAGLDMRRVLKPEIDIPWNKNSVKEHIWRPIMKAQLGKKSTTEMTTGDIDKVFDTITKHLGEKFGLFIDFPSIDFLVGSGSNTYETQITKSLTEDK